MKIKVTWTIQGMDFEAISDTIASAYEYIKAIVKKEELNFPNQEETLSEYMGILASIQRGKTLSHENHIFKIERIR